jgi:peptidyl-dipeptidase Dcp
MKPFTPMSLAALMLASVSAPAVAQVPAGTGVFAQPSTLPFHAPDFTKIHDDDFQPAIEQGIAITQSEVRAIADSAEAPTFTNTIEALERSGQMLDRVTTVFSALTGANTNDKLDAVDTATSPKLAALRDSIDLDPKLFARVKSLYDRRAALGLTADQTQVLTLTYNRMVHNGALLSDADKTRLKEIDGKLSSLGTAFGQKLTAGTKDGAFFTTDKAALAGLSEADLAAAAKDAEARKLPAGSYVLSMQNTTQQPLAVKLTNRATRQALLERSLNRSERGDANDTRALIQQMSELRAEQARLLGAPNFATLTMYDQMAKNPQTALAFIGKLVGPLAAAQKQEAAELDAVIKQSGGNFAVTPADWPFYAEKLRKARYDIDESQVKPYFEIHRVLEDGVFYAANQLYGLTFKKRTDIPVYQADVSVYEVSDQDGSSLALFYFDPWKRDNKSGGAWMSNFVNQSTLLGLKPVVYNVENFTKPAPGQPALITADDVNTMFHEFGHALHGMLSNGRYPSISGTSTARDFVEFPSQFNENWASDPKVFAHYARHYQTGAPMPAALVARIKAARKFDQAYALGESTAAALLDLKWHALPVGSAHPDVDAFEAKALAETGLDTAHVPPRYRSSYFRHIWGNGYAAGYYAYSWTEMLDHDAFHWFETHGGLTRANGQRFRDMILSKGHSQDYAVMFRNFTGHDPQVGPMLEARGLVAEPAKAAPGKKTVRKRRR